MIVGHPEHRRVQSFQQTLHQRGWPDAIIVPWLHLHEHLLQREIDLEIPLLIRLESPGQHAAVDRYFLTLGGQVPEERDLACERLSEREIAALPEDRGRLLAPRQWYRGFRFLLRLLKTHFQHMAHVQWLNPPDDVERLFDKRDCQTLFQAAGIRIPPPLSGVHDFESLRQAMDEHAVRRVFVKLACGSSAAGVMALEVHRDQIRARTTMESVYHDGAWRYYNSRTIREYRDWSAVARLVDYIGHEGAQVERWLPKWTLGSKPCDVRQLMIAGRPAHAVVRCSQTPLTNLHLRNERLPIHILQEQIPIATWQRAMADCERVAACFTGSLHVGVDLLFTRSGQQHAILEANAFGDLLGDVLHAGQSTYEAELAALEGSPACGI